MKKNTRLLSIVLSLSLMLGLYSNTAAFATTAPYIKSDTPATLNIPANGHYIFKFTVVGTIKGTPTFTCGDPNNFEVFVSEQSGNNYYVRVNSNGAYGDSAGIYSKLPGQAPVRQAVLKTTERVDDYRTSLGWSYSKTNRSTLGTIKQWIGISVENQLFGSDEYSGTLLTITNSNPDVLQLNTCADYTPSSSITVNATTTEKTEELRGYLWSSDGMEAPSENRFVVKGLKPGTGTITITSKSPKTGKVFTDTEVYTIYDQSHNSITTDTTAQVNISLNKSYTFKCKVSSEPAMSEAWFYTKGNAYSKDSGTEEAIDLGLKTECTYAGNGVYYVKVTAIPDTNGIGGNFYLKSGEPFSLIWCMPNLDSVSIGNIKVI